MIYGEKCKTIHYGHTDNLCCHAHDNQGHDNQDYQYAMNFENTESVMEKWS